MNQMVEDPGKTKTERLSEKARRADALQVAKRWERDVYGNVVADLGNFPELDSLYQSARRAEVQRELLARWDEALESVEFDRAAFRGAMTDRFEANWQFRQALLGLSWVLGIWLSVALAVVFGARALFPFQFFGQNALALIGTASLLIATSMRGFGERLLKAFRSRRYANLDFFAAESLLKKAVREVALPSQLRQMRRTTRRPPMATETPAEVPPDEALSLASLVPPIDPSNLVELYQSPQQLATAGRQHLKSLVDALGAASLGIAGPRGVGKTSLLEWFFDHQYTSAGHLAVRIPAPVRYEPRDFVLSAFAQVCEAVMGGRDVPILSGRVRFFASTAAIVLGLASLVAGILVYATQISIGGSTRHLVGLGLLALGGLVLVLRASSNARRSITPRYLSNNVIRDSANPDEIAPQLFNEICFQLTFATGYSGKLAAGPGELATETSYSLAARQESFPDVVARFRAFLEAVATQRGKVYIGIDELDKMQVDDAVRFLDDIKGLFGVAKCFFLVCISEDALGQFERRGLPIRDAFDSAFDEVVRLEPLKARESITLLNKRTDIDPELSTVCHILAGGLPRDVIRHARRLAIFSQNQVTMEKAVSLLVHQDLQERARGMKLSGENQVANDDESLRRLCSATEPIPTAELTGIANSLQPSFASLSCVTLLAVTILELLTANPAALRDEADTLAGMRLGIAESPGRSWSQCIELREEHALSPAGVA